MLFHPQVGDQLSVDGVTYYITEHPAVPGMPYGQEGRQATVYQLVAEDGEKKALKAFKPRYRLPALVYLTDRLAAFAELRGLQVCQRTVLNAQQHGTLLREFSDLIYSVIMPWVEGPTWMQVMLDERPLSPEQSLSLARSLTEVLAGMEVRGLAHCDLSGPNVMLPVLALPCSPEGESRADSTLLAEGERSPVVLVDVEQMYGPGLERPQMLLSGSPGYAHRTAPEGLWTLSADRFAGAVLLAEMLGWCDERVRQAAWGENYSDPAEMQQDGERYKLLIKVLQEQWGDDVTQLFLRAWHSETLADCPTLGEWLVRLPESVPELPVPPPLPVAPDAVRVLMELARRFEKQGNLSSALETYRQALTLAPPESSLAEELRLIVKDSGMKGGDGIPVPPPPLGAEEEEAELARLFDDGLAAYVQKRWAAAKELLDEVVRRRADYSRNGQRARDVLTDIERQLSSPRRRLFAYMMTYLTGGVTILLLACICLIILHFAVLRPAIENAIYDVMQPALRSLIAVKPNSMAVGTHCLELTEQEINQALTATVQDVMVLERLDVQLREDSIFASGQIGGRTVWIEAEPTASADDGYFNLDRLRVSWLLQLIFSPKGLKQFIEGYVNEDVANAGRIRLLTLTVHEDSISTCFYKHY